MIKNSNSIAILLATYNGSLYLCEQIDSLLSQTFQDFQIYIHDDGSTDNTLQIINEYNKKLPDKIHYLPDDQQGRGAKNSFFWLLQQVESNYYMFCDQDDIWLPSKIEDTYKRMMDVEKQHNPSIPILIHTDLAITNQSLKVIHESLWKYLRLKVDISKKYDFILQCNVVTGCTILMNHAVKEKAFPAYNDIYMHDWWFAIIAAKYGVVENLKSCTVLYRQHGKNVCGINKIDRSIRQRIKNLFELIKDIKGLLKFLSYSYARFIIYKFIYTIKKL